MKKILLTFITLVIVFSNVCAKNFKTNKIIYLDAGHGGVDPGACYKDIYEKDINLNITLKLKEKLEKEGFIVLLTRLDDYDLSTKNAKLRKRSDLSNRAKMINESNADIYLSIHLNSSNNATYNGIQIFYDDINTKNKMIAELFQKKLNKNKKALEITDLYMYKNIYVPGVLLELGFISNTNDRNNLLDDDYQNTIIDKIKDSIIDLLSKNVI